MPTLSDARIALDLVHTVLDEQEAQALELDELRTALWDIRAVLGSVVPLTSATPHSHLADLLWETLSRLPGGTTHADREEDPDAEDPAA